MSRQSFLPFALPDIDDSELTQITEVLTSGWVTTGPKTKQFEQEFAKAVGAKHAIAVNSCTAAMHLALEAVGVKRGDEVITTPYTFAASAEVIRYFDAKPVLVDVCADTCNIDPNLIEAAITERTKAIIPVHIAGMAANLDAIAEIATRHNLAVIEDAAHAFPAQYQGRWIGQSASSQPTSVVCFSFYATKTITTAEGGMICTDNDEIADRCRIMALHGISRDAWKRYTAEGSWYYEIIAPGYKYNMTDVASAMGLAQLAKAEKMWDRRRKIAMTYSAAFASFPALQPPISFDPTETSYWKGAKNNGAGDGAVKGAVEGYQHAWHLYMLRLHLDRLKISRAQFIDELKTRKIGVSVHFIPLHIHPYYRETYGYQPEDFPVAYNEFQREISLPIYSKMSDQDVQDVIEAVIEIVEQNCC